MLENRIYSVVVYQPDGTHLFYGTFSNRKNMLDSIKNNLELSGVYIKGARKNLDITPVTIANGFVGNGLTMYKKDEEDTEKVFMKILMHTMNSINPYYKGKKKVAEENEQRPGSNQTLLI